MTQIRKVSFYFFSVISFSVLLFSNLTLAETDAEKAQAIIKITQEEKNHFPEGSLDDSEYVKKILKLMAETDEQGRGKFFTMQNPTEEARKALIMMDQFHLEKMKTILTRHGWTNISKFGKEADQHSAYLIQHADSDPVFQAGCAFVLEELVKQNETSPLHAAYLYDRVAAAFKLKQRYGTQASINPSSRQPELLPYEGTLSELDERRKKLGLPSIEDYLKLIKQFYVDKKEASEISKELNGEQTTVQ